MRLFSIITTLVISLSIHAYAQTETATTAPVSTATSAAKQDPTFSEYYTINEKVPNTSSNLETSLSPDAIASELAEAAKRVVFNLLKWTLHEKTRPVPTESYIRKLHFGRWINDPTDDTCMNTRAKVLVRDSENDVTYRGDKKCVVEEGKWLDPYTSAELTSSREIQIDHMVPLKNAYISGAYKWDYKMRCLYANYMGFHDHLLPASGKQNMAKGDRGPEKYLPPELSYRCQYIKNWLTIKFIWRLNMNPDEAQAIHEAVNNYNCDMSDFKVTQKQLRDQRQFITDNIEFCMLNKR